MINPSQILFEQGMKKMKCYQIFGSDVKELEQIMSSSFRFPFLPVSHKVLLHLETTLSDNFSLGHITCIDCFKLRN